jgi:hypothetical protein
MINYHKSHEAIDAQDDKRHEDSLSHNQPLSTSLAFYLIIESLAHEDHYNLESNGQHRHHANDE